MIHRIHVLLWDQEFVIDNLFMIVYRDHVGTLYQASKNWSSSIRLG